MQNVSDAELLREFVSRGNDDAFREIVSRHTDLIYSAALRQVNSPDHAADIAQKVFTDLARKADEIAKKFSADASLAGWLFRSTRFAALNLLRDEQRRRAHERQAMEQLLTNSESADWSHIRPLLDEAMDALSDDDRDALLLRFFKNQNLREVGEQLKISDDAAQKRVSRAVEKLREFFSKQKITIGASGLTLLISVNAVQSAPMGLVATISATAIFAGKTISTSTVIAATKTIAMTTLQKTFVVAALTAAIGTGIYQAHQNSQLREQVKNLQQTQNEQLAQLQRERDDATNQLAGLLAENAQLKSNSNENELLKLRGEVTQMRNEADVENAPAFQKARLWTAKENKLRQQFEDHPDQWIPEMKYLSEEEWLDQARKADLDSVNGVRCALSNVRAAATFKFAGMISQALRQYMATHNQQLPDSTSELASYFGKFKNPINDVDTILTRYEILTREEQENPANQGAIIIQNKNTLVDHIDSAVLIGPTTTSTVPAPSWAPGFPDELEPLAKAYNDANHQGFLSIYDLEPYATNSAQKESLNNFIKSATFR